MPSVEFELAEYVRDGVKFAQYGGQYCSPECNFFDGYYSDMREGAESAYCRIFHRYYENDELRPVTVKVRDQNILAFERCEQCLAFFVAGGDK